MAIKALDKVLEKNYNADRIDVAYIKNDKKKFTRMPAEEVAKIITKARKK